MRLDWQVFFNIFSSVGGYLTGLFNNQSFTNVFSALLGAIVGALSGYVFNRQLEKNKTRERYLIQRKNTIFSPIYKQLLALKNYLENAKNLRVSVEFSDKDSYGNFNFSIWDSIKKDVRRSYIDPRVQAQLDSLTKRILSQQKLQLLVFKDVRDLSQQFITRNSPFLKMAVVVNGPAQTVPSPNIETILVESIMPYRLHASQNEREYLINTLSNAYTFSHNECENHADTLLKEVKKLPSFKRLKRSLKQLIIFTDELISVFAIYINRIIEEYEGGVNIE